MKMVLKYFFGIMGHNKIGVFLQFQIIKPRMMRASCTSNLKVTYKLLVDINYVYIFNEFYQTNI